ncbi:endolytic transglycosylase MltG [Arthrobacter sp. UYCu723]
MSPVNSDDSSGDAFGGSGRPLTRKELRAREKSLLTQGHEAIPPQAFETGQDSPTAPPPRPAPDAESAPNRPEPQPEAARPQTQPPGPPRHSEPLGTADAPELPAAEPTVHEEAAHEDAVDEDAGHEYAGGISPEAEPHRAADQQHFYQTHHGAEHHGNEAHPDDEAHVVYADEAVRDPDYHHEEAGHEVMAGASAIRTAKGPSKKIRRRRRFLALVLSLTVFVVAIVVGAQLVKPLLGGDTVADYPGPGTGEVTITVPPGAGPKSVATELQDKKVVANADAFLKEFAASGGALSPGDFSLRTEMKNSDAVDVLLNKDKGKVMYFALSAGLRIGESLQAISEGTGVPASQLKELSDSPAQFGLPAKSKNLEGFLAPGEYRFPLGTPAKDILQKLVSATLDELKVQGVTDQAKQYDAVTVASIVQAEGGQAEYGDVAGAVYNRLKPDNTETNGLIQSDATVTYGLGIRSFHIDEAQKTDKSNPYNTYANTGLPAGPIGSPGKTAIDAAAKPKSNDYLYWVTINLDTKETKFSKTLAEHNGYVEKYNAWCEANPGRCV